jgi:hypothetical protein
VLAAALERALLGRAALVREAAAAEAAPNAPALREALRLSAARIELLLARLAACEPPAAGRDRPAAGPPGFLLAASPA